MDKLNNLTEQFGAPALRKLVSDASEYIEGDLVTLSFLVANLWIRTPYRIQEHAAVEQSLADQLRSIVEPMKEKVRKGLINIDDLPQTPAMRGDGPSQPYDEFMAEYEKTQQPGGYRDTAANIYNSLPSIAKWIQKMHIRVVRAVPETFFVTSDNPVVLVSAVSGSRSGVGWANQDAMALMAIDPGHLLSKTSKCL